MRGHEIIQGPARLFKQGSARLEDRLLLKQGDASAGVQTHVAVVRPIKPRQDAQQRGLADAVRSNQTYAVAGLKLEGKIGKERAFIKAARKARATQQQHDFSGYQNRHTVGIGRAVGRIANLCYRSRYYQMKSGNLGIGGTK